MNSLSKLCKSYKLPHDAVEQAMKSIVNITISGLQRLACSQPVHCTSPVL